MDTALPQKFTFILDKNLAKANYTGNHVCTSCDKVVLGYFLKALMCPRLNWVNYYKLEQPFRIQDSYARPQAGIQSIKMIILL